MEFISENICIGAAIHAMKEGYEVTRSSWIEMGDALKLAIQEPDQNSKMTEPYLYIKYEAGEVEPYTLLNEDIMADDWRVVKPCCKTCELEAGISKVIEGFDEKKLDEVAKDFHKFMNKHFPENYFVLKEGEAN